ncbi:cell division protein YlmG [Enterococcus canis]|uniref:Cell division protein YlmG n=1 Tax=Enterococcus canis TaxID=214095 RepID=A0A1L8RDA4_9ENTE|nr:YggT family protein [Enterococcus canis]OJG17723.1 cell division protein YlmG [Enterococcus canis]
MYQLLSLLNDAVQIYTFILVIYALLSWFPGAYDSAFGRLIAKISEPYLSLFDRLNLHIGMIDFTIIVAVVVLQLAAGGLSIILRMFV